jgi:hypothetical protein
MEFIKGKSYKSLITVGRHRKQGNVYIAQETRSYIIYLSDLDNKSRTSWSEIRDGEVGWEEVIEDSIDTSFPEKWCIEGDWVEKGLIPADHWFDKIYKGGQGDTYFRSNIYYSSSYYHTYVPDDHTLVTKEQLINHYKLNNKQDELHKETEGHRITGSIRVNAVRKKIIPASSSGFTGSRITGGRKRTAVRSVKIIYNKVLA